MPYFHTKGVHSLVHDPSDGKACRLSKVDSLLPGFDSSNERIAQVGWAVINTHACEQQMRLRDVHRLITANTYAELAVRKRHQT